VSTQTVQTAGVTATPRVNLMPPEIAEAERFRRLQMAMGGAVVLSAVVVGLLYQHAHSGISSAQNDLTAAQNDHSDLQGKLDNLSNVSQTFADVQAKQALLSQAMGNEIRWSYVLNDLSYRVPSDFWLTAVQATETVADPAAATSLTTLTPGALGTISFNGVAIKHDDVAAWLDALAKEKGFSNPTFSNSSQGTIGSRTVYFNSSQADITNDALSNRFTKAGS
jgi:Tfp pilus assembly protein PilN